MSNPIPFPNRTRQMWDETYGWIVCLDRGLSEAEHEALRAWLAEDPRHARALLEIAKFWDRLDVLAKLADAAPLRERKNVDHRKRRLGIAFASVAASALVLGLAVVLSDYWAPTAIDQPTVARRVSYETAPGEHSSVQLIDGSAVTLNTSTAVDVAYSQTERNIFLDHGEAYFVVQHDANRPFNVYVGARLIQAVGTAFNVELDADETVEVIVSEGRVRVAFSDAWDTGEVTASDIAGEPPREPGEQLILSAGEAVRIGTALGPVYSLSRNEIGMRFAWQEGMLVFRSEPLEQVLEEVSRYTTIRFDIADESLRTVQVGGYFQAGDVEGLLLVLRENFQIGSRRVGPDQIVLTAL